MSDVVVTLEGGPCNGEDRTLTDAELKVGRLTCKGTLYIRSDAFKSQENIVFATSEAIGKATSGDSAAHVTQAWTRWMRALGHKGPHAHNRIQRATVRVRRIARNR